MNKKYIVLLLLLFCLPSYAQDKVTKDDDTKKDVKVVEPTKAEPAKIEPAKTESAEVDAAELKEARKFSALYQDELQKNNSLRVELEGLNEKKSGVEKELSDLDKRIKSDSTQLVKAGKRLKTKKEELKQSDVEELQRQQKELSAAMDRLRDSTATLDKNLQDINAQIANTEQQIKGLETIKDEQYKEIVEKYGPKLEQPFSSMTNDDLEKIKKACHPFLRVDKRVEEFVRRVRIIKGYKHIYDSAKKVCSSKYDKSAIEKSLKEIASVERINDKQKEDLNVIKKQLEVFDEGVLVFREFINWLNAKRKNAQIYSVSDFKDDLSIDVFTENGEKSDLEKKIEQYIRPVIYLNREFDKYLNAMRKDPMKHPAIEQEILGCNM